MKKLLLVLVPAVLLLTSCLGDDDNNYTPPPPELSLYNSFVTIKGFGEIVKDVVDDFIAKRKAGEDIAGVSFVDDVNGVTTELTANMSAVVNSGYYGHNNNMAQYFRGELKATITKLDEERTSIVINVNGLTKVSDGYVYGAHNYAGSIDVIDNLGESTSSVLVREINFNEFSLEEDDYSLNFRYILTYEGYDTSGTSDDVYTWRADDMGFGKINDFASYSVSIDEPIVKKGSLSFTSSGTFRFIVTNPSSEIAISPYFSAVYKDGVVTVNGIEYTQGVSY